MSSNKYLQSIAGLLIIVFFVAMAIPIDVFAQRSQGSSYRSKINKLDDDKVEKLPIPILFGVTLGMVWSNFGDPRDGGDREHEGLDIMAPEGAPIVSPTEAVVIRTGDGSGSGKYVTTANPGGESFVYMHLSEISVRAGDELDEGDLIGLVGDTGNARGGAPHLHWEIRDGRRATDPFPRITHAFSLEDKIEFLDGVLDDVDDEDELVEFIVDNYQGELWQARAAGMELPRDVEEALGSIERIVPAEAVRVIDLTLDSQGPLVATLQGFLILKATGPAASLLADVGATGYFGSLTQRALAEYQSAHGIAPASGYFGPLTRSYIATYEATQ